LYHFIYSIIIALLVTGSAFSQTPDTLVVYEYIHVTDTVWMETEVLELESIETAILHIDTLNMKGRIELIYPEKSATIPINHIILSDNLLKLESMKQITLLGLTFLVLQTSTWAQNKTHFSFFIKENFNYQGYHYPVFENSYASPINYFSLIDRGNEPPSFSFGIKGNINFFKSTSISPSISYQSKSASIRNGYSSISSPSDTLFAHNYSPTREKQFSYLVLDFTIKHTFNKGKQIKPYVFGGIRNNIRISEIKDDKLIDELYNTFRRFDYGLLVGTGLLFKERFYLDIEFSRDLTWFVNNDKLKIRNSTLGFTLGFYIF
jgi:hypothetical protein